MLVNTGKTRVVIGRLSILPGEKVPPVALTAEESEAIAAFAHAGIFKEVGSASKPEPAPVVEAPKPQETPVVEAPVFEEPAVKEGGKGKKGKAD